jgi:hypothetical protein
MFNDDISPPAGILTDDEAAAIRAAGGPAAAPPHLRDFFTAHLNQYDAFRVSAPRQVDLEEAARKERVLEELTLDFDKATAGQELVSLKFAPDEPTRAQARESLVVDTYINARTGRAFTGATREKMRDAVAVSTFGEGKGVGSDAAFMTEAKAWQTSRRETRSRAQAFHEAGQMDAITLFPADSMQRAAELADIFKLSEKAPGERDALTQSYLKQRLAAEQVAAPLRPVAKEIQGLLKSTETERFGDAGQAALETAIDRLAELNPAQRGLVVRMLKDQAAPESDLNGVEKSVSAGIRGLTGMLRGAGDYVKREVMLAVTAKAAEGTLNVLRDGTVADTFAALQGRGKPRGISDGPSALRPATAEEAAQLKAMADKELNRMEVANQAIGILEGTIDPIKGDGLLQEFSIEVGSTLGAMVPIMVPYAGVAVATGAYADQEYHRQRAMGTDAQTAQTMALATGAVQAAVERASFLFAFAPKSMLGKLAPKFTSPGLATSATAQVAGRVAVTQAAEYTEEIVQGAVPIFTA